MPCHPSSQQVEVGIARRRGPMCAAGRQRRAACDHGGEPVAPQRAGAYALCTMCIGIGQGIAVVLERV